MAVLSSEALRLTSPIHQCLPCDDAEAYQSFPTHTPARALTRISIPLATSAQVALEQAGPTADTMRRCSLGGKSSRKQVKVYAQSGSCETQIYKCRTNLLVQLDETA